MASPVISQKVRASEKEDKQVLLLLKKIFGESSAIRKEISQIHKEFEKIKDSEEELSKKIDIKFKSIDKLNGSVNEKYYKTEQSITNTKESLYKKLEDTFEFNQLAFDKIQDNMYNKVDDILVSVKQGSESMEFFISEKFRKFSKVFDDAIGGIWKLIKKIPETKSFLEKVWSVIKWVGGFVIAGIVAFLVYKYWNKFVGYYDAIKHFVIKWSNILWNRIQTLPFFKAIQDAISETYKFLSDIYKEFLKPVLDSLWEVVKQFVSNTWKEFKEFIDSSYVYIKKKIENFIKQIPKIIFDQVINAVLTIPIIQQAISTYNAFDSRVYAIIRKVMTKTETMLTAKIEPVTSAMTDIKGAQNVVKEELKFTRLAFESNGKVVLEQIDILGNRLKILKTYNETWFESIKSFFSDFKLSEFVKKAFDLAKVSVKWIADLAIMISKFDVVVEFIESTRVLLSRSNGILATVGKYLMRAIIVWDLISGLFEQEGGFGIKIVNAVKKTGVELFNIFATGAYRILGSIASLFGFDEFNDGVQRAADGAVALVDDVVTSGINLLRKDSDTKVLTQRARDEKNRIEQATKEMQEESRRHQQKDEDDARNKELNAKLKALKKTAEDSFNKVTTTVGEQINRVSCTIGFRFDQLSESFGKIVKSIKESVLYYTKPIRDALHSFWESHKSQYDNIIQKLTPLYEKLKESVKKTWSKVSGFFGGMISEAEQAIPGITDKIKSFVFPSLAADETTMKKTGEDIGKAKEGAQKATDLESLSDTTMQYIGNGINNVISAISDIGEKIFKKLNEPEVPVKYDPPVAAPVNVESPAPKKTIDIVSPQQAVVHSGVKELDTKLEEGLKKMDVEAQKRHEEAKKFNENMGISLASLSSANYTGLATVNKTVMMANLDKAAASGKTFTPDSVIENKRNPDGILTRATRR